jgi:hypothetical protein
VKYIAATLLSLLMPLMVHAWGMQQQQVVVRERVLVPAAVPSYSFVQHVVQYSALPEAVDFAAADPCATANAAAYAGVPTYSGLGFRVRVIRRPRPGPRVFVGF